MINDNKSRVLNKQTISTPPFFLIILPFLAILSAQSKDLSSRSLFFVKLAVFSRMRKGGGGEKIPISPVSVQLLGKNCRPGPRPATENSALSLSGKHKS